MLHDPATTPPFAPGPLPSPAARPAARRSHRARLRSRLALLAFLCAVSGSLGFVLLLPDPLFGAQEIRMNPVAFPLRPLAALALSLASFAVAAYAWRQTAANLHRLDAALRLRGRLPLLLAGPFTALAIALSWTQLR